MSSALIRSASAARKVLIITWLGFLLTNLAIILYLYLDHWIERDNFKSALQQLNACYAPYIGAITLYYWTSPRPKSQGTGQVGTSFTLAWLCSFIWNGMLVIFLLPLLFQSGTVDDSIENIREVGSLLSWLVAGAIGYYFANPTASTK